MPNPGKLCLVVEDDFSTFNTDLWQRENQFNGFQCVLRPRCCLPPSTAIDASAFRSLRSGEFEWATTAEKNSFVADNTMYLVPTLTQDELGSDRLLNGYTLDLGEACTASNKTGPNCVITSNSSMGVIIPPVQSARLTTKLSHSIRYGKVEFQAKMPTGDWIWPSIWMLPTENYYGPWPISGEIDVRPACFRLSATGDTEN